MSLTFYCILILSKWWSIYYLSWVLTYLVNLAKLVIILTNPLKVLKLRDLAYNPEKYNHTLQKMQKDGWAKYQ